MYSIIDNHRNIKYNIPHARKTKIYKTVGNIKCHQEREAIGIHIHCWWEYKWYDPWKKNCSVVVSKVEYILLYESRNSFLDIVSTKSFAHIYQETHIKMFIIKIFLRVKTYGKWMNKLQYIHTMKYYIAVKIDAL